MDLLWPTLDFPKVSKFHQVILSSERSFSSECQKNSFCKKNRNAKFIFITGSQVSLYVSLFGVLFADPTVPVSQLRSQPLPPGEIRRLQDGVFSKQWWLRVIELYHDQVINCVQIVDFCLGKKTCGPVKTLDKLRVFGAHLEQFGG